MKLPPELICMVKSSLTNRDLYFVDLTCRYLFWCSVSNKECQLRKCNLWNQSKEQIICGIDHPAKYCSHVLCWKYRCQYLSLEDVRMWDNCALGWAADKGHLTVMRYLCEKFQLTIQDVRSRDNWALRGAAINGHLPIIKYLCETFPLTIEDVLSDNYKNAFHWASFYGHLPLVQYFCEKFHLPVVQYMQQKYKIDE
jgi:hypothetical protein